MRPEESEEARVAYLRELAQLDQEEAAVDNQTYDEMLIRARQEGILSRAARAHNERVAWERRTWRAKVAMILASVIGFLALALMASGCCTGHIRSEAVDEGMRRVCERHDRYVVNDPSLDPAKKQSYLTTSGLVIRVLDEAKTKPGEEDPDSTETQDARLVFNHCDYPGPGECGCVPEVGECNAPCKGCCPTAGCLANCPDRPTKESP